MGTVPALRSALRLHVFEQPSVLGAQNVDPYPLTA